MPHVEDIPYSTCVAVTFIDTQLLELTFFRRVQLVHLKASEYWNEQGTEFTLDSLKTLQAPVNFATAVLGAVVASYSSLGHYLIYENIKIRIQFEIKR